MHEQGKTHRDYIADKATEVPDVIAVPDGSPAVADVARHAARDRLLSFPMMAAATLGGLDVAAVGYRERAAYRSPQPEQTAAEARAAIAAAEAKRARKAAKRIANRTPTTATI